MKIILIKMTLLHFILLGGCSSGWSVGNLGTESEDSTFVHLVDQDSIPHYYDAKLSFNMDSWCYVHGQWEVIRKNE